MTVRNKILAIKGKPVKRHPVHCKSAAEAEALKAQWRLENAVRTLSARVLYLADQVDRLRTKRRPTDNR